MLLVPWRLCLRSAISCDCCSILPSTHCMQFMLRSLLLKGELSLVQLLDACSEDAFHYACLHAGTSETCADDQQPWQPPSNEDMLAALCLLVQHDCVRSNSSSIYDDNSRVSSASVFVADLDRTLQLLRCDCPSFHTYTFLTCPQLAIAIATAI